MPKKATYDELLEKIKKLEEETSEKSFSENVLRTLFLISNAVTSTLSLFELYENIYKFLNELMTLPNFYIAIYDSETHSISFPYFIDRFDDQSSYESSFLENKSLTGEVILKKESIFLTKTMLEKREKEKTIIGTPPQIYIGVPLLVQKKVIGVMAVQSYEDENYFNRANQELLVAVSNQIATAIERKRTLDQIDVLQNYLFNIINSMPSILVGVDKDEVVTQWNYHAVKEIGILAEKAVGKNLKEVFPRLANNIDQIRKSITLKKIQTKLKQGYIKNGETRYEDLIIFPLITNGVEGAVIRIDDVTDRVRLEKMIIQSEKMLSIGGLAAGMAHEINNPLAGIIQTANVLSKRLSEQKKIPANEKAAEEAGISLDNLNKYIAIRGIPHMISSIIDSGKQISEIVKNMLTFARKSDGVFSSHNPITLVEDILDLAGTDYNFKMNYDFKAILIKKEFEENLPKVFCEGSEIQQVLLNILVNGAQAMQVYREKNKDFEAIFIVRLKKNEPLNMLRIELEDNGPGMSHGIKKRIFEPFFTTKPVGIGTGLGLSVSFFIITENHKGRMNVESTPGIGTKFIIDLPYE